MGAKHRGINLSTKGIENFISTLLVDTKNHAMGNVQHITRFF